VPFSHKFAKESRVGIFRNECTRITPLDPRLVFWGVLDRFVTARKSMHNLLNWCHYRTSSVNKVTSEFFVTNAPDPLHWTQDSSFGAFRTVSLMHESRCKLAELVPWTHKFAKQGRIRIFRNKHTRSTLLDLKLMFWCVSNHFGTAQKLMQNLPNWCHYRTSSLNKVASEFFATNAPDQLLLDPKLMFCGVSDHFDTARKSMQN
jgi:hypothetical protein